MTKVKRRMMLKSSVEGDVAYIEEYWGEGKKKQDSTGGE